MQRGRLEAPGWEDKNLTIQNGCQRAPKAIAQTIVFLYIFCKFCSSGCIGGRSQRALLCKKSKKALVLQLFRRPRWAQHRAPEGTSKMKKRVPRCMGTLWRKTERAPRCMGMLFVFLWSSWVPPRRSPPKCARPLLFNICF